MCFDSGGGGRKEEEDGFEQLGSVGRRRRRVGLTTMAAEKSGEGEEGAT